MAPFHLDFNPLDCEALDVLFAFDFMFSGNHDEVVAEALGLNTTLESLLQMPGSRVINYEPSLMLALDEACRLQCRLSIETRTNAYQIRTGQFPEAPISVYFTVRQYWGRQPFKDFGESYRNQRRRLPGAGRFAHHSRGGPAAGPDDCRQAVRRAAMSSAQTENEPSFADPSEKGRRRCRRIRLTPANGRGATSLWRTSSRPTGRRVGVTNSLTGECEVSPTLNCRTTWFWNGSMAGCSPTATSHREVINYVSVRCRVFIPGRRQATCPEPDLAAYRDYPYPLPAPNAALAGI